MKIPADQWATVSSLLDEALDLDAVARPGWLDRLTAREPQIGSLVGQLLATHAARETADVLATLPRLSAAAAPALPAAGLAAGDRVGPYRLLRELGSGGMADVWLAERADGAFTREVALKLPRINRLRRDLAVRFARERDILARLEHPNIARLYDAGVAAGDLPYLAMEYVDGQPITAWCDAQQLNIAARLLLFRQVLDAVQFAHSNLVIHRDLKPSNILVTADGQVRLLDFGIAKLLADDERAQETQLTQVSGRALTPDYASPEQIKGEPLTIASDVYSLGVVLYELLAGSRPYKLKLQSAAQLELAILEAESIAPSANAVEGASATRRTTPRQLSRLLAGDLDTITLKALSKTPLHRYQTIAAFAEDLQRYHDGLPVAATAPSRSYRARKFLLRHKLAVIAGTTVACTLLAAALISARQAQIARSNALKAQAEATRAEAVQAFLLDIFRSNSDRQRDPIRARNTTARELLDIGAERLETALQDAPEARADIMKTLSEMYYQLQLEEQSSAIETRRIELLKKLYGPDDPRVADALIKLAAALHATPRRNEILPALTEAKRILDHAGDHSSQLRGELLTRLAQRHQNISYEKMLAFADEAVRVLRPYQIESEDRLSTALHLAARARVQLGDFREGEQLYRESIEELKKSRPVPHVAVVQALTSLAESQAAQLKLDAAIVSYRDAVEAARTYLGESDPGLIFSEAKLGSLLHTSGQRQEARRLHQQALERALRVKGDSDTLFTPVARMEYGRSLLAEGRLAEADDLVQRVNASNRVHYAGSAVLAAGLRTQAVIDTARGRYDTARRGFAEAFELWRKGTGGGLHPSRNNRFFLDQAVLNLALGDGRAATELLQQVVAPKNVELLPISRDEIERDVLMAQADLLSNLPASALTRARDAHDRLAASPLVVSFPTLEADVALQLGRALHRSGQTRSALPYLERSVKLRRSQDHDLSPWLAESEIALTDCLTALGEFAQARTELSRASARLAAHKELGEHFKRPLHELRKRLSTS